jgi:hypothetical protein
LELALGFLFFFGVFAIVVLIENFGMGFYRDPIYAGSYCVGAFWGLIQFSPALTKIYPRKDLAAFLKIPEDLITLENALWARIFEARTAQQTQKFWIAQIKWENALKRARIKEVREK